MGRRRPEFIEPRDWFWMLVETGGDDECWPFRGAGARQGPHGYCMCEHGWAGAHRYAYSYETGEWPWGAGGDAADLDAAIATAERCRAEGSGRCAHFSNVTARVDSHVGIASPLTDRRTTGPVSVGVTLERPSL